MDKSNPKDILKDQKEEAKRRQQNHQQKNLNQQAHRYEVSDFKIDQPKADIVSPVYLGSQSVKNIVADFNKSIIATGATRDLTTKINDDEIIIKMKLN